MNDPYGRTDSLHDAAQTVSDTAHRVADKVQGAAGKAGDMAQELHEAVVEFRRVVREQPVTMGLMLLGVGYVVGRIMTPRRR